MTTALERMDQASAEAHAIRIKLRWWLGGFAYCLYCAFGHYIPYDVDSGVFRWLNSKGAFFGTLICLCFVGTLYAELRKANRHAYETTMAWINDPAEKAARAKREAEREAVRARRSAGP